MRVSAAPCSWVDVLINCEELCRSVLGGSAWSCCDAMGAEMKLGDTLLVERTNGAAWQIEALRKHYREEFDLGETKANAQVAGFLC